MTTRRKTWMGVGLFAIAGTAIPTATQTALASSDAAIVKAGAAAKLAPLMFAQAGGEQGGEGGMAAPESYALPGVTPPAYDAKAEIAAYAAGVRASYVASVENAKTMSAAIDALLANPTVETLAAARKAWTAARPSYLVTESYRFYDGPIEDVEGEINSWPMNEAFIDYVVGNDKAGIINDPSKDITVASLIVDNQATDESDVTLGWHAIEFLLWGQDLSATGPGDRPVSDYIAGQGNNDRRRTYLKIVTARMIADIQRVADAWAPGVADNYAATFQALPQVEAIGRILNGIGVLAGSELMSERMAVGLDSGDQEDEHSCFSDTTHQDFVYDVKGVENVWTGKFPGAEGPGMRDLVAKVDPASAKEVDGLLADATTKIAATGDPWDQVLAAAPDTQARKDAEAAVASLGALADGIKRAAAKLGVLVQIPTGG
ncbi:MAG TPA: imelysin family protein [Bauldia sp.]|nr:imelysin family protein [Bauldia sp.]